MRQAKVATSFDISHFRLERFACRKPVFDTQGAFFVHKELSEVVGGHHLSPLISSTKPSRRSDTHERKGGNDGAAGPIPRILAREPVLPWPIRPGIPTRAAPRPRLFGLGQGGH